MVLRGRWPGRGLWTRRRLRTRSGLRSRLRSGTGLCLRPGLGSRARFVGTRLLWLRRPCFRLRLNWPCLWLGLDRPGFRLLLDRPGLLRRSLGLGGTPDLRSGLRCWWLGEPLLLGLRLAR